MELTFLGATRTVTGSKYLLTIGKQKVLVDCGLFQGQKELRLRNWAPLPVDPKSIDSVLITHAHIDHTGYLPLLVKNGFAGPIYATAATFDLSSILLPDSGYLHEEEARRANKYGYSKHHPALPLYTREDGETALKQFKKIDFGKPYPLVPGGSVTWFPAGHILGASLVQVQVGKKKVLFTGDLGRFDDPLMRAPERILGADYLILESTYGNHVHDVIDPEEKLKQIINETASRGGTILIPSFAVGRAQSLLYYIFKLKSEKLIPDLPVFLDSPMAINATKLLCRHAKDHRLTDAECREVCKVAMCTNSVEQSKSIDAIAFPKIIISASGMAVGGRILHHLKVFAPQERNTILLTGFQAAGTRGEKLLSGCTEIKIHGEYFPVRARVEKLTNTSAHADYEEILHWLRNFKRAPKKVFITHGELEASQSLKEHIETDLGWSCYIPKYMDKETLA
ncbi:MAG: MBL fold metallo-hydrolase [Alphaproteobacteria bacterium]|jgi:metallo-beta-lactamase family protein|nr:MBL fold metallo-hydrolase [Alphaproteobacteria bacterium]MBT5389505.1 MBL fold metallo-hydrolase [Alphaproteobacteria bacterium]MBT5540080.1 MBL fold metallo-hydrolase [Alphaproteobacteria bacterium]MBT5654093.1 MBL fold metallo-hydrolase [Alphaproteobacteria bacterium]